VSIATCGVCFYYRVWRREDEQVGSQSRGEWMFVVARRWGVRSLEVGGASEALNATVRRGACEQGHGISFAADAAERAVFLFAFVFVRR